MANVAEIRTKMTLEEFFEWQKLQDMNYELRDGVPVATVKAMSGATRRHDYVTTNAIGSLFGRLGDGPCRPSTSDQSIVTDRGTRRPDVLIECGEYDDLAMAATEPRVVIEVWSPSNVKPEFILKMDEYRANETIQVILIVDTREPSVGVWRRVEAEWTFQTVSGLEEIVPLPEIDTELPLSELYRRLSFPTT